jgi:hypothetical protein
MRQISGRLEIQKTRPVGPYVCFTPKGRRKEISAFSHRLGQYGTSGVARHDISEEQAREFNGEVCRFAHRASQALFDARLEAVGAPIAVKWCPSISFKRSKELMMPTTLFSWVTTTWWILRLRMIRAATLGSL